MNIPARRGNGWGGWVAGSLCVAGVPGVAGNTTAPRPPRVSAGIVTKQRASREFHKKNPPEVFFYEMPGAAGQGCEPGIS